MFSERSHAGYEAEKMANEAMMAEAAETIVKHNKQERLDEENFNELFQKNEIEGDRKLVSTFKKKFEDGLMELSGQEVKKIKERQKIGEAMEIVVTEAGELYNWFGPNANIIRTTEFDDIFNGIDAVIEFSNGDEEGPEHIALTIDVTTSNDFENLKKKIERNKNSLTGKEKNRKKVKYFHSPTTDEKQTLETVVPVVVALDAEHSKELLSDFAQIKKLTNKEGKNDNDRKLIRECKERMAENPAQIIFLQEIAVQLDYYQRQLDLDKKTSDEINNILALVYEIIDSKQNIDAAKLTESDKCFKKILNLMED